MTRTDATTQRDELARDIFIATHEWMQSDEAAMEWAEMTEPNYYSNAADALIAAGWTKPAASTDEPTGSASITAIGPRTHVLTIGPEAIERAARALCAFDYGNPDEAAFEYEKHGEAEYLPAARAMAVAMIGGEEWR